MSRSRAAAAVGGSEGGRACRRWHLECRLKASGVAPAAAQRDFEFNNSEEWYQSIPKNVRPRKDQPFYHLLAENDEITYEAYVSEQNLLMDDSEDPIKHPLIEEIFSGKRGSSYFKPSN